MTRAGIHYEVSGGPSPNVVFLHGVTLDATMWSAQLSAFGARWRCLTVDLPGHGSSAPLRAGYDTTDDILGVLDEAGATDRVMVGLSLGGYEAVRFAGLQPGRCRALVLVDAWLPGPEIGGWEPPWRLARSAGRDAAMEAWLRDPLFAGAALNPPVARALHSMVRANDLRVWTEEIPRRRGPSPRELAPAIRVPTGVVVGEHDLAGFRAVAEWLAQNIPGARGRPVEVVAGAGHLPPMEAPEAFNRVLASMVEAGPWAS